MTDPAAALELVTIAVASLLMLLAGLDKRQLERKPRRPRRQRPPKRS